MIINNDTLKPIRLSKIIATLGPASFSETGVEQLIKAGVDIFRINFSHGDHEQHLETIHRIRSVSDSLNLNIPILQDLGGPKLRINELSQNQINLLPGKRIRLESGIDVGDAACLGFTDEGWFSKVQSGERVVLGDGIIHLRILHKDKVGLDCEILSGGTLRSRAGLNFPDSDLLLGAMRPKDWDDLQFGLKQEVDAVALSFVQGPEDLIGVRAQMEAYEKQPLLIAKIERPEAVQLIDSILEQADGIMVARGDLGINVPLEKVPTIQKMLIKRAREHRKFVITATQMLESMTQSPIPTRAEVTDVANAVLDGTDAVMLSGETAVGVDPPHVVKTMATILVEAESQANFAMLSEIEDTIDSAISHAVPVLVREIKSNIVITPLTSGSTAARISRQRIGVVILAGVSSKRNARFIRFYHAVLPVVVDHMAGIKLNLANIVKYAKEQKLVLNGEHIVVTGGFPLDKLGVTNFVRILKVGDEI